MVEDEGASMAGGRDDEEAESASMIAREEGRATGERGEEALTPAEASCCVGGVVEGLRRRRGKGTGADEKKTKRPTDNDFKQQRLKAWTPVLRPRGVVAILASFGVFCGAVGLAVGGIFDDGAVAASKTYDGKGRGSDACHIAVADEGKVCEVRITLDEDMKRPIRVYYEIENFHQNHRNYMKSFSWDQLTHPGTPRSESYLEDYYCMPLVKNGSRILHPCGVVPNTLFNDVITLVEPGDLRLKEDGIDPAPKMLYKMPPGFKWARLAPGDANDACLAAGAHAPGGRPGVRCAPDLCEAQLGTTEACFGYVCAGGAKDAEKCAAGDEVVFTYEDHDKYQYLYETFPQVISPLVGVNSERFAVWMTLAALNPFRKLYGRVTDRDLKKGETLVFRVENNWEVGAFQGTKRLVLAGLGDYGFESRFVAYLYLFVGGFSLVAAAGFAALGATVGLRKTGDESLIPWLALKPAALQPEPGAGDAAEDADASLDSVSDVADPEGVALRQDDAGEERASHAEAD